MYGVWEAEQRELARAMVEDAAKLAFFRLMKDVKELGELGDERRWNQKVFCMKALVEDVRFQLDIMLREHYGKYV